MSKRNQLNKLLNRPEERNQNDEERNETPAVNTMSEETDISETATGTSHFPSHEAQRTITHTYYTCNHTRIDSDLTTSRDHLDNSGVSREITFKNGSSISRKMLQRSILVSYKNWYSRRI